MIIHSLTSKCRLRAVWPAPYWAQGQTQRGCGPYLRRAFGPGEEAGQGQRPLTYKTADVCKQARCPSRGCLEKHAFGKVPVLRTPAVTLPTTVHTEMVTLSVLFLLQTITTCLPSTTSVGAVFKVNASCPLQRLYLSSVCDTKLCLLVSPGGLRSPPSLAFTPTASPRFLFSSVPLARCNDGVCHSSSCGRQLFHTLALAILFRPCPLHDEFTLSAQQ